MAEKKKQTQAQKAASKSASPKKTATKKNAAVSGKTQNNEEMKEHEKTIVPFRLITSAVCAALFILFLVMFLQPGGALLDPIHDLIFGLVGPVTYYISIPALLYLFIIQAFSAGRPIKMRSICLISFVLICGCISHLAMQPWTVGTGFQLISDLYMGGISGNTAGVLCGCVAMLLHWLCEDAMSYIILIVAALLTLLGAMQITIPSLIRAVQNRPRADWEDEVEDKPEPASLVVNHLAAKRIEYVENRRRKQEEAVNVDIPIDGEPEYTPKKKKLSPKAADIMSQIDSDVQKPVSAAGERVVAEPDDSIFTPVSAPRKKEITQDIPKNMPVLEIDEAEAYASEPVPAEPIEAPAKEKVTAKEAAVEAAIVAQEIAQQAAVIEKPVYKYPPIELLKRGKGSGMDGTAEMRENTARLNETLASFKIEAHIINVTRGPSVTRYEVELDKGVRLNKLTSIADDIALSLGASGVRIAAIPGKISVVGIEVPNRAVSTVSLRDVIDSNEFSKAKSKSSFAVGKDIAGNNIVGNIAKLPHMLIAGTTGSGKSVCMNSIIISLLYKASPDDVKLIMIDPKMVELGIYNAIPHLLIPVVTDPKKAAGSLQWAVTEMMRRYKSMSDAGVRDLESYNAIMEHEEGVKLPQVVVIIDELADLMLVAAKEVEESICRIAQMGRAAGIHLIIATQRPSADVITGLMKANIPSRIAFAVASAMESRIILDTMGAEKLVGKGDMLFSPIGSGKPLRVQGCFVSDPEVEAVATFVKENYNTSYDNDIMADIEKRASQTGSSKPVTASDPEPDDADFDGDEMLPAAVDVILETGQASVSMLQRRLKLGYARAARIVDEMEEKGIVGPFQGSKPRTILVTKEQWEAMKGGQTVQMDFDDLSEGVPEELD